MEPEEVGDAYLKQANKLFEFIKVLENNQFTNEEYKTMLITLCHKYYELLVNLAIFTPLLSTYKVKFYHIDALDSKFNHPPFDIEFFEKHQF